MHGIALPLHSGHGVLLTVFAVVLIAPRVARALRLPDLVGLIIGGVLVGQHGVGLIERTGTIEALGTAGLLYLMFQAGLELDRDDLARHRKAAMVFGACTFAFPFALGVILHVAIGYETLAALLLGSCWASHTLLTYPMFQQAHAVSNRAVSIGVAGTVITDTAALLVLVALARAHEGELTATSLALQVPALVAAGALVLVGLPRLAAWFFSGFGRDRSARFIFVMVGLYGSALLAEVVGVEPIIGAFFAGLAMNRNVAEGSELEQRVRQFGTALLVPVFLISVGMLIDPATAFTDRRTLFLAGGFTCAVIVGKSLAAAATARIYRLDRAERSVLVALSVPQAAATLAAVFVGFEIGVLEQRTVDAVVLVILLTCLFGTSTARRAIGRMPPSPRRATPLGKRILVPIDTPRADDPLLELAASLGKRDGGTVLPVSVLDLGSTHAEATSLHERMVATVEQTALAHGCDARSIVRLDLTPASGLVHAAIEADATLIVLPWDGHRTGRHDRFSHTADTLLDLANAPMIIVKTGKLTRYRRIVLRLEPDDLAPSDLAVADLCWLVGSRLSQHLKLPLVLASHADPAALAAVTTITNHVDEVEQLDGLFADAARPSGDLVIRNLASSRGDDSTIWVAIPRAHPRSGAAVPRAVNAARPVTA